MKLVAPGSVAVSAPPVTDAFEKAWYRVAWQKDKGILSLTDRASGVQVMDPAVGALGSPIYQLFPGGDRGGAGTVFPPRRRPADQATAGRCSAIKRVAFGPVYERWEFHYEVPEASQYAPVTTFFRDLPQFELIARPIKTDVRDPEGMYVLFPFAVPGGIWHLDKPGGGDPAWPRPMAAKLHGLLPGAARGDAGGRGLRG